MSPEQINGIIIGVVIGVVVLLTIFGFLAYRITKRKKNKNIQKFKQQEQIFELVDNETKENFDATSHDEIEDLDTTKKFDNFVQEENDAIDSLDDLINGKDEHTEK